MRNSKLLLLFLALSLLALTSGCHQDSSQSKSIISNQGKAEDAIKAWMQSSNEYPKYKPIVFGELTPRYQQSSITLPLVHRLEMEKAKEKSEINQRLIDSLEIEIERHQVVLLGYLLPHRYEKTNIAGEIFQEELLFFLDTSLRVASALSPESFDFILDERVFFQLDPTP